MGNNLTKFQNEVFGGMFMERLPKPDAVTGAVYTGQLQLKGQECEFQLHPAEAEQKSDFRIALKNRKGRWVEFGTAGWKETRMGSPYIELRVQNTDFVPGVAFYAAFWDEKDQPKEWKPEDDPIFYTVKRTHGNGNRNRVPADDFGFDQDAA